MGLDVDGVPKPNKFHARQAVYDGIIFPSLQERDRYLVLKDEQRLGQIRTLCHHQRWKLAINGVELGFYEADFSYDRKHWSGSWQTGSSSWLPVVEDVKGMFEGSSPAFRLAKLKIRLMKALHGIDVVIVRQGSSEETP